jgi:hypothetical protein
MARLTRWLFSLTTDDKSIIGGQSLCSRTAECQEPNYETHQKSDANGNVVVTGNSQDGLDFSFDAFPHRNDFYTAKYAAADGALLWEKRYNGPVNGDDEAQAVTVEAGGNVLVTGYSRGPASHSDFYTVK